MGRTSRGVTLTELLIAAALVSFVALGFAALYGTAQTYMTNTLTSSESQGDAAYAIEHLSRNLRRGTNVTFTGGNLDITFRNTITDTSDTVMRYTQTGTNLIFTPDLAAPGTTQTLIRNLESTGGLVVSLPTGIRRAMITIKTDTAGRKTDLKSSVNLRGTS